MHYSILIYGAEAVTSRISEEEEAAYLKQHHELQAQLKESGAFGPTAKLAPTATAVTLQKEGEEIIVTDGPFAETKEQFLGFYLVECSNMEAAIKAGSQICGMSHRIEIRPIEWLGGPEK